LQCHHCWLPSSRTTSRRNKVKANPACVVPGDRRNIRKPWRGSFCLRRLPTMARISMMIVFVLRQFFYRKCQAASSLWRVVWGGARADRDMSGPSFDTLSIANELEKEDGFAPSASSQPVATMKPCARRNTGMDRRANIGSEDPLTYVKSWPNHDRWCMTWRCLAAKHPNNPDRQMRTMNDKR